MRGRRGALLAFPGSLFEDALIEDTRLLAGLLRRLGACEPASPDKHLPALAGIQGLELDGNAGLAPVPGNILQLQMASDTTAAYFP